MENKHVITLVENRVKGLNIAFEIAKEMNNEIDLSKFEQERLELVRWLISNG